MNLLSTNGALLTGRSFSRKAAEVILPLKSASPMPYDSGQDPPSLLVTATPPSFVLFTRALCSWGRDSRCMQVGGTFGQAERQRATLYSWSHLCKPEIAKSSAVSLGLHDLDRDLHDRSPPLDIHNPHLQIREIWIHHPVRKSLCSTTPKPQTITEREVWPMLHTESTS